MTPSARSKVGVERKPTVEREGESAVEGGTSLGGEGNAKAIAARLGALLAGSAVGARIAELNTSRRTRGFATRSEPARVQDLPAASPSATCAAARAAERQAAACLARGHA
jgi:hypothetical protein